jgi:mono/diheme cytochrome c family protein
MSSLPERLAPPPTVYPPSQADQGAQVYYLVCMVCHGDRGQGLTEDWLNVLNPEDRNCWQSHCHASNHPPEGFKMPEFVPAIIGPGELEPFRTALILHDYLQARMPWQAPGNLSEDEYWQLTAYMLRENGFDPGPLPLDRERAAEISLVARPTPSPTPGNPLAVFLESAGVGFWVASGGVLALVVLVVLMAVILRSVKR